MQWTDQDALASLVEASARLTEARKAYTRALIAAKVEHSYHEIGKALGLTRAGAQSAVKQARTAK